MYKEALHKALGSYLKKKRLSAGLTQNQVAKKLGYSTPQFISNIERGLCSPPLKNLRTLVKLYDIPTEEILVLIMREQEAIFRRALSGSSKRSKRARSS